jgi:hypothetical protein
VGVGVSLGVGVGIDGDVIGDGDETLLSPLLANNVPANTTIAIAAVAIAYQTIRESPRKSGVAPSGGGVGGTTNSGCGADGRGVASGDTGSGAAMLGGGGSGTITGAGTGTGGFGAANAGTSTDFGRGTTNSLGAAGGVGAGSNAGSTRVSSPSNDGISVFCVGGSGPVARSVAGSGGRSGGGTGVRTTASRARDA